MKRRTLLTLRIIGLWFLIVLTFISWYLLMGNLFSNKLFIPGILVAYSLPAIIAIVDALFSRGERDAFPKVAHLFTLIILVFLYWLIFIFFTKGSVEILTPEAVIGIGLISVVMSLMLYPIAGAKLYHQYKRPLFVAGVIFMPLFIAIATYGLTVTKPLIHMLHELEESGTLTHEQFFAKATQELITPSYVLLAILAGFWASAAWLASRKTQGFYVPGLEIRPMMAFRPDFILPGGVNFVKGALLTGMGLILMIHIDPTLPRWNWWGFVLAFFGIILLIPLRGMYKMLLRRGRLLGTKLNGSKLTRKGISWFKESLIFIGLLILLYGFLNAFKAVVPFTELLPEAKDWPGIIPLIISFWILVPLRGYYKLRLREGAESNWQLFLKQFLLWLGVVVMVLSFATFLKEKIHVKPTTLNFATNPLDFKVGLVIFIFGALLILLFRPIALRNEFVATIRMMPGLLSTLTEAKRKEIMKKRLIVLASYPEEQRLIHLKPMLEGLNSLPEESRKAVRKSMMETLATLEGEKRAPLMKTMDRVLVGT